MEIITLTYPFTEQSIERHARAQVLAIGQFDGLHLGHASVIKTAVELASRAGIPASVMTFYPHPKEVMKKGDYEGYLTPPKMKEQIFRDMGLDYVYIIEFNEAFSRISPEYFVSGMLVPLQVRTAVVGFDFRYGYKGEGDAQMLRELSKDMVDVYEVPPFLIGNEKVSSSGIRKALQEGAVDFAGRLLGRSYTLNGTVVHGEKRGRLLGFPTANLNPDEHYVTPAAGVYAVKVRHEGMRYSGVMNVGVKPTFHSDGMVPSFEIHLFDFSGDLYGDTMSVELLGFIRRERKFASVEELIGQIAMDTETAKILLQGVE